jgi:hypothetical protein
MRRFVRLQMARLKALSKVNGQCDTVFTIRRSGAIGAT